MAQQPRPDAARIAEERLAHALISRGLLNNEELARGRAGPREGIGPQALLRRLVKAGLLTAGQAERARQELEALLAQQIPGLQLVEKLGQGAMGMVYKARQLSMNRMVAVKILHSHVAANSLLVEELTREAHLVARLNHANIVQAIDVGQAGPLHYFVMELVEGQTIRQALDKGKIYGEKEALALIVQVARALEHASKRGLIHRDVKPANIVLTADGTAKLADLGMARDTADDRRAHKEKGLAIGTPYYMAPEQIRGRLDVDSRADLYSLGATLYHMVTGRPPFPARSVEAVLHGHLHEELTPPDHINSSLSGGLGQVVETMLAKDRRRRYANAGDLVLDLEALLRDETPRLTGIRRSADVLAGLAEGEDDEPEEVEIVDDEDEGEHEDETRKLKIGVGVLAGVLFLSGLLNLVLLLRR
jgi:eukaryotic-like serine/threonine-protein kinase